MALVALAAVCAIFALAPSAAASDDTCPLGFYEVNASLVADNPGSCQWMQVQGPLSLGTIVPSDVIVIRNGTYNISWNLTFNGISFIGDSRAGVILDGQGIGPALRIQGFDTNLTDLTMRTSNGSALAVMAGTARTAITRVSVTGAAGAGPSVDLAGSSVTVRDLSVATPRGVSVTGSSADVVGLDITTSLAAISQRLFVGAPDGMFSNVTLQGTTAFAGLNLSAGATNQSFSGLSIMNCTHDVYDNSVGATMFSNITLQAFTATGFLQNGPLSSSATVNLANINGAGTYGIFVTDGDLTLTNSTVRNAPTGLQHAGNTLTMSNVSFDTHASAAVRKAADGGLILWNGGSATRSPYGVIALAPNAGTQSGHSFSNITFTNLSTNAILLTGGAVLVWSQVTIVDCTFINTTDALAFSGSSARPGANFVIARNTFTNLGTAMWGAVTQMLMTDNVLTNVRYGIYVIISPFDQSNNWNTVTTTNLIDGRPVYYLLNVSDMTVPAGASQVYLINVTNVTVSGLAQTAAYYGVWSVLSRVVTISDSVIMGNGSIGVAFFNSSQITLRNLTVPTSFNGAIYLESVTGATVDSVYSPNASYLVQTYLSQRIFVTNITDGGAGSGTMLWVRNSALVTADGIWGGTIRAANVGVLVDLSNNITVRNVTLSGGNIGASVTNSPDVTLQFLSFSNTRLGVNLQASPRAFVDGAIVTANLSVFTVTGSPFATLRGITGSSVSNSQTFSNSADSRLIDSQITGRGVAADNSDRFSALNVTVIVPANLVAFHLGTETSPSVVGLALSSSTPWAAGGRGLEVNQVTTGSADDLRIDGFDNGVVIAFSSFSIIRAVQTNATQYGYNAQNTGALSVRDSSFGAILGPAVYLLNPSFLAAPSLYHSSFVSQRSWGGRFSNADGLSCIDCNFTAAPGLAAVFIEASTINASFVHSNFYGTGIDNPSDTGFFDGGFPNGGNYYSWAAAAFLDQMTGAGQNVAGYDGLADVPFNVSLTRIDVYPLMDPWPPGAWLTSPPDGSLIRGGTVINFSISNYFTWVDWTTDTGMMGTLSYPHDLDTSAWVDGVHRISLRAYDLYAPDATVTATFTVDSTPPTVTAVPAVGTAMVARGTFITFTAADAHPGTFTVVLDGATYSGPAINVSTAGLADGAHTFTITAVDAVGNTLAETWTFTIDGTPPTLAAVESDDPAFLRPGGALHYTASDASGIAAVTYTATPVGGGAPLNGVLSTGGADRGLSTTGWADGCYDVVVTARDNVGLQTSAPSRRVCVDGTAPDLSAMSDVYTVDEGLLFIMPGDFVTDLDGQLTFSWSLVLPGGPSVLEGPHATLIFARPGNYTVTATVQDRLVNVGTKTFTVVVADATAPTASFEVPLEWPEDTALALNGSGSSDNSVDPLSFLWSTSGPSGDDTAAGPTASFTFATPGLHSIMLRVTDSTGHRANTTRVVRILDVTPPTLVVTGARAVVNEGETLHLDASGSTDNDPAGAVFITWSFVRAGAPVTVSAATLDQLFDSVSGLAMTFNVTATDSAGNSGSDTIQVTINGAPRITKGPVATAHELTASTWVLEANDPNAGDTVLFHLVTGPPGMTMEGASLYWTPPSGAAGAHTVVIQVTDGAAYANFTYTVVVEAAPGVATPGGESTGLWIVILLVVAAAALIAGRRMGRQRHDDHDHDHGSDLAEAPAIQHDPIKAKPIDNAVDPDHDDLRY